MPETTTIRFEDAVHQNKLSQLILEHGVVFSQLKEFTFSYFTGDLSLLVQYLDRFTFPRLSKHAQLANLSGSFTAVFALENNRFIGSAILNHQNIENCIIECFNILPSYRQEGIGQMLLKVIEEMAKKGQYQRLSVLFRTYWKKANIWEQMLVSNHWQSQPPLMYYGIVTNPLLQQQTQWFQKASKNCPYEFLTANAANFHLLKNDLYQGKWQHKIPLALDPFQLPTLLDEQTSFIVKKDGLIIGWMLNHQLRKDLWQITTVFLLPEHRGAGPALFAEFLRRHDNRGQFNFMIQPNNKKMYAFAKRYFVPAGANISEQKKFIKNIK